ncbi:hypothetical protein OsJ_24263 [Oryza sativa Japonica Group]|uniref:Uncharacterized protein n=1 Tax=Oryza sativa subsp. japonica TaxID=39947 RepID=B9FX88_ORYSJ|nr:hypothetical protein OsJ_24263 [Oryza sativa Japonica Group]
MAKGQTASAPGSSQQIVRYRSSVGDRWSKSGWGLRLEELVGFEQRRNGVLHTEASFERQRPRAADRARRWKALD